ncbi:hypothetical protein [Carboxydothermus hydrogenoformans]|uniref:hypothetical protein n=1 Tax=Carboxydothermus hydrogenoformans TaxID=129958 RepID=UPI0002EDC49A|nr:hypothetical protein [Carboxydothermus hydrogenoformans]
MRGKLIFIVILILFLTGCKDNIKKEPSYNEIVNKQKQTVLAIDYGKLEEKYLSDFKSFWPDSNILYTKIIDFDNDKNFDLIVLYEDKKTGKRSNVAYVGKRGIYAIDVAADKPYFIFKEPLQITFKEEEGQIKGIIIPIINEKTKEQFYYTISMIATGNDQTFKIKAEKY